MNKIKNLPTAPKPLTKEEKAQRLAAFLAQKKEQLFQGCFFSMLSNPEYYHIGPEVMADRAEEFATAAHYKLYPNLKPEE